MDRCGRTRARPAEGRERERGQAIIEMVVVLPLLLFLVFGIVEFAAAWRTYHVVTNSSREGARRAAVLASTGNTQEVEDAVSDRLAAGGLDPDLAIINVNCEASDGTRTQGVCTDPGRADEVEVVFPYTFRVLGPVATLICGDGCDEAYGVVNLTAMTVMRHE